MDEEGLFKLNGIDQKYYTLDLINSFGIEGPVCDGYGHYKTCIWFVQEVESSDVDYGIEQLKSTVEQLEKKNQKVDKIFLVIKRFKSKQYEGKRGFVHVKGSKDPYMIRGKPIKIVKYYEIKKGSEWRYF